MEVDRGQLYDHVEASHRTLAQRLTALDVRCAQQAHAMDRLGGERADAMRAHCERAAAEGTRHARRHAEQCARAAQAAMRADMHAWLEGRGERGNTSFDVDAPPPPGALWRSKSDDTLSQSSATGRRRPTRLTERGREELRAEAAVGEPRSRSKDDVLEAGGGGGGRGGAVHFRTRTRSFHVPRRASGRSPEGCAEEAQYREVTEGEGGGGYDTWYRQPGRSTATATARQFEQAEGEAAAGRGGGNPPPENTTTVLAQVHRTATHTATHTATQPTKCDGVKGGDNAVGEGNVAAGGAGSGTAENKDTRRRYEPQTGRPDARTGGTAVRPPDARTGGTAVRPPAAAELIGKATQV